MATTPLERSFASTRDILANVKVDQLSDPTPCESWNVRDLINHIVNGTKWFGDNAESAEGIPPGDTDFGDQDFLAAYEMGVTSTVATFSKPEILEKVIKLPFGDLPGAFVTGIASMDVFTHGWDLAKATGQSTDLDPELATELLTQAEMTIPDQFRGDDGVMPFGAKKEASAGATNADRLAAFLGRSC